LKAKALRQNLTGIDLTHSTMLKERLALTREAGQPRVAKRHHPLPERREKTDVLPGDTVVAQFQTITGQNNVEISASRRSPSIRASSAP